MKILVRWAPAIVVCVIIFLSSAQHGTVISQSYLWNYAANKAAHIFLYFILCFAFDRGTKNVLSAVVLTVLYGISDELHQQFVPTRSGQLTDVLIDAVAAGTAGLILWTFYQDLPKKLKNWLNA